MANLQFERIVQITEVMHQYARVGNWEQVQLSDSRRQQLLDDAILAQTMVTNEQGLEKIQDLNNKILELARKDQRRLQSDHQKTRHNLQKCSAYLETSRRSK